jgi:putative ABC transport system substrate-binding protein
MPVIGFLDSGSFAANTRKVDAFRQGLAEAGYVEGSNVAIEISLGGYAILAIAVNGR